MAEPMIYVSNEDLARRLYQCFAKSCPVCHVASTPSEAINTLEEHRHEDIVAVLDTMLPWRNSFSVLEEIEENHVPTLYLSQTPISLSHMQAICDVPCEALSAPSSEEEIVTAVNRLEKNACPLLTVGDVVLDKSQNVVRLGDEEQSFTKQEFALLRVLMEHCDVALSREQLLYMAWGFTFAGETRTVDVHVQRLRMKLGKEFIRTIRSKGYMVSSACQR